MSEKYFKQPSTTLSQTHFAQIPASEIQRSSFDRSHGYKTTFNEGFIYPVYLDEVLPGDTFEMKATAFARMNTLLHPIMDNLYLDLHFFWVPNRLVWANWTQFMGERINPTDNPENYTVPKVDIDLNRQEHTDLASYFGIPSYQGTGPSTISVNALPFRAYKLIWNYWYRDENVMNSVAVPTGNGPDTYDTTYKQLLGRSKKHDYFTSCLPWPQKGSPVYIPLGTRAEIGYDDIVPGVNAMRISSTADLSDSRRVQQNSANTNLVYEAPALGAVGVNTGFAKTNLFTDLTDATAITINDLRTAFQIQRMLERDARGGTRYKELILSHFGVNMPDAQWQPEYLGGGHTMINVSPVAATYTGTEVATGDLGAIGTALGNASFKKSFTEHGFVMGFISVRSDLTYQNGVERFWRRNTRYDYYWPTLAHLGEQAVFNYELFAQGAAVPGADDTVWGYQERYAEYRYKPGRITGVLASNNPVSLDTWHVAQDFDSVPPLNYIFLYDAPSIDRVVAVPSQPKFILDAWFQLKCHRPMPTYSVPGLVDHF